jgi:hypothetical protein
MSHGYSLIAVEGPLAQVKKQVAWEMEPFKEYEDPERGPIDGSGWDWYEVGGARYGGLGGTNIVQVKMLNLEAVRAVEVVRRAAVYENLYDCPNPPREYDLQKGETQDQYVTRKMANYHFSKNVFLHNRLWHECEHRGVWPFEDEERKRRAERRHADPQEFFVKSLYAPDRLGEEIVWDESRRTWEEEFFGRFIKPLDPDWFLVLVHYHV